jgi:hypothetical protein
VHELVEPLPARPLNGPQPIKVDAAPLGFGQ